MIAIRKFHRGAQTQEPVVWIIGRRQWPRALLRTELIERGFEAVGYMELSHALAALRHPNVLKPSLIVLELFGLSFGRDELEALVRFEVPTVLLGGAMQLSRPFIGELEWAAVMKRPFTVGDVADLVERISYRTRHGGG